MNETEHSHLMLERILTSAQKLFGHYGLSKTTMNNIADDIGISKASLYYYFKDKENVFIAVAEKEQEYFVQEMKKKIDSTNKSELVLIGYVDLRLRLLKKLLTLGKFSQGNYSEVKPLLATTMRKFRLEEMKMIADIIREGVNRKEFSVKQIDKHAEFFINTLRSIRQMTVTDYTESGTIEISPEKYRKLIQQSKMFTELFIKGISV